MFSRAVGSTYLRGFKSACVGACRVSIQQSHKSPTCSAKWASARLAVSGQTELQPHQRASFVPNNRILIMFFSEYMFNEP